MVQRKHWNDLQSVIEEYGMDSPAVDTGSGCMIIQDSDIAADILWAIRVLSDAKTEQKQEKMVELMPQIRTNSTYEGDNWRGPGME